MNDPFDATGDIGRRRIRTLDGIAGQIDDGQSVLRGTLSYGDWIVVTTRNSTYSICVVGDDTYSVSGGWFDRQGVSPARIAVNGCTWGGSAIKHDIVAAPGLFLEFGNRVVTTRIQAVRVVRHDEDEAVH